MGRAAANTGIMPTALVAVEQYLPRSQRIVDDGLAIRSRISVYFPRVPSRLPLIRRHELPDRVVRLVHAAARAAVDRDGSLATWRFGRVDFSRSLKCARHLNTEVAQNRSTRLGRVMVEENVVAISPQTRLAANERPDLVQGRPQAAATAPGATSRYTAAILWG